MQMDVWIDPYQSLVSYIQYSVEIRSQNLLICRESMDLAVAN